MTDALAEHPTQPPLAPSRRTTRVLHGRERHDDHEWLRAKDDPEVRGLLEAENAWTQASTAHLADLRERLVEEIRSRTQETDLSVPARRGGHWYYGRSFAGREYGASCRAPVADRSDWTPPTPAQTEPDEPALPGEQVLLDLDALAEGHEFFSLGGVSVSRDEHLLAWATDVVGDERYDVRVKDLRTGELLPDHLTGTGGGLTWAPDGSAFYYVTVDDAWRADKVWRHVLGTEQAQDEVVHHETDERFRVGVGHTRSHRFLVVVSHSKTTAEYHVLDGERPELGLRVFVPRQTDLDYALEHAVIAGEDRFVITHNADGPDFGVSTSPVDPTPVQEWEPLIPHDPATRIEDVDAFATHLVVSQRSEGLSRLRVLVLGDGGVTDDFVIPFDREVYTVGLGRNSEFETPVVRLGFGSLAVPSSVYDFDVATRALTLLRRTPVLGGFSVEDHEEHR
ncbi:MAG: ptrB, partial [Marmoricola sp.]|nr:ptrB [Marmoricola sp.]